jgi:hypothetical protein
MSSPLLSPDELRAAAETHRELGPEYQNAVVESFLDKIGSVIDARVDERIAQHASAPARPSAMFLAIGSMVLGIPLSAIAVAAGAHPAGLAGLLVIWIAIAVINVGYSLRTPPGRR